MEKPPLLGVSTIFRAEHPPAIRHWCENCIFLKTCQQIILPLLWHNYAKAAKLSPVESKPATKRRLNQPPAFHRRNKHFRSKKLHSRALQGDFGNENADLRDLTGRFISTLAGRFQVTADSEMMLRRFKRRFRWQKAFAFILTI